MSDKKDTNYESEIAIKITEETYTLWDNGHSGMALIEALAEIIADYDIDLSEINRFISPKLRSDLQAEGIEMRQIKTDGSESALDFGD